MQYNPKGIDNDTLKALYKNMLLPRMIEEKMLLLLRKGKISKWFSGIGQEAISIGTVMAIEDDEYILPLHRNLGIFTGRDMPLNQLFAQLQGKKNGFSNGRERSFHFGSNAYHIAGMISHLGPQLSVGSGIALAHLLNKEPKLSVAFSGDGGTSQGEFHEALNVASVWNLPIIFLVENNGYGLSTPVSEQFKNENISQKAEAYSMKGLRIDGNNILEVYSTIKNLAEQIRKNPEPVLLECMTFRMRGHEEASGTKYVPAELFENWKKKDPLDNYEKFLLEQKVIDQNFINENRQKFALDIDNALNDASKEAFPEADTDNEVNDIYKSYDFERSKNDSLNIDNNYDFMIAPASAKKEKKRYVDAVSEGLYQSMEKFDKLILMGQDIAAYGGVFKITDGFLEKFGNQRVRNTPLCESAILGIALGLSVKGYKSMVEMQFADFVTCGFNQIVNNFAKIHYRWGQNADVVVRMPTGAGVGAGPFHSQSNEAWFFHIPGLKIVYPSNAVDAKGLLTASIEDPNPVMFFEHKALYRSISDEVYQDYYTIEIGKARKITEGNDVTVITYGAGVHWALYVVGEMKDISAEIIDLRTLLPWDKDTVSASVKKTSKVIILHEDTLSGGIGAEISAWITEHCFEYLDAPVMREASLDTPVPFAPTLEKNFLPIKRFEDKLKKLMEY